jgi:hypothetical protein
MPCNAFWTVFKFGDWSGFYHIQESETGAQVRMNDVFGAPFEGTLFHGWDDVPVKLLTRPLNSFKQQYCTHGSWK